jgi:hypothetical protein
MRIAQLICGIMGRLRARDQALGYLVFHRQEEPIFGSKSLQASIDRSVSPLSRVSMPWPGSCRVTVYDFWKH